LVEQILIVTDGKAILQLRHGGLNSWRGCGGDQLAQHGVVSIALTVPNFIILLYNRG